MAFDPFSSESLLPFLQPLFLGGGDTIMLHVDPGDWTVQWEERRDDRIQFRTPVAPGSCSITARSTRRFIQQRWVDSLIISLHQSGFQSRAIWAESSIFICS